MSNSSYEFSREQNDAVSLLAQRMRVVGVLLLLVGILVTGETILLLRFGQGTVVGIAVAVALGLIGYWSIRAAREFFRIVTTQGADLSHMMTGLREIRKLYDLQFWTLIVLVFMASLGVFAVAVGAGRMTGPYP
jgi:hypothetical protein